MNYYSKTYEPNPWMTHGVLVSVPRDDKGLVLLSVLLSVKCGGFSSKAFMWSGLTDVHVVIVKPQCIMMQLPVPFVYVEIDSKQPTTLTV